MLLRDLLSRIKDYSGGSRWGVLEKMLELGCVVRRPIEYSRNKSQ